MRLPTINARTSNPPAPLRVLQVSRNACAKWIRVSDFHLFLFLNSVCLTAFVFFLFYYFIIFVRMRLSD